MTHITTGDSYDDVARMLEVMEPLMSRSFPNPRVAKVVDHLSGSVSKEYEHTHLDNQVSSLDQGYHFSKNPALDVNIDHIVRVECHDNMFDSALHAWDAMFYDSFPLNP
ncbi:uncharacterized protein BJ212DRAFT_1301965 [Suillus subaureus]|uniref:Uncharacterized protein n=1 Tax=Suillus subaureus TaxID=48587 RepID=A0A9P7E559_9AGAM|nr:uncharacterized protein BJ212DRAFT_1301965 [Suillus subaureus]KAG1811448.1 hypothetical protein BJ212DRAFT_1301965 [Suillus subaureus]